jgi:hypothetical protein
MVKAILDGRKTQTRRIIKSVVSYVACPYGVAGDRLWVRETFARCHPGLLQKLDPDLDSAHWFNLYRADGVTSNYIADYGNQWTPSIHMPRWASRLTLEITKVRVERLQDISEEDAKAEGISLRDDSMLYEPGGEHGTLTAAQAYANLWDSLYGKGAWEKNPWVLVIEFRRITP